MVELHWKYQFMIYENNSKIKSHYLTRLLIQALAPAHDFFVRILLDAFLNSESRNLRHENRMKLNVAHYNSVPKIYEDN
jgi:hypothetical protein